MTEYATAVDALAKVTGLFLEFPLPPCPYCHVDTDSDGDNFTCPECGAWWSSDLPHLHPATRECVECEDNAQVVDDDGQPHQEAVYEAESKEIVAKMRARVGGIDSHA